jgi:hypothetical protein
MNNLGRNAALLMALGVLGCGDDGETPGSSLAEGESYLSIELSGDTLDETLRFEGKTDEIGLYVFDDDISALASSDIGLESGDFTLGRMTLSIRLTEPGTVDENGFDINLVVEGFNNEFGTSGYSLREKEGSTLTVTEVSDERVRGTFEFDASPTQGNSTDLVFHLKGSFEIRE